MQQDAEILMIELLRSDEKAVVGSMHSLTKRITCRHTKVRKGSVFICPSDE
jgi:hypothetical protein